MSFAINEADRMAHLKNKIKSISKSDKFTKEDHDKFLEKNSFYCKNLNIRITKFACTIYQARSITSSKYEPVHKCMSCSKFDKKIIKKPKIKKCKLEVEFPGFCFGNGRFKQKLAQKDSQFDQKHYCSVECGARYNYFKTVKGWNSVKDITGKMVEQWG